MRFRKLFIALFIVSVLLFVSACNEDSGTNEPENTAAQTAIKTEMTVMDQMVTEVAGGPMLSAMLQFQAISAEFFGDVSFPFSPRVIQDNSLHKFAGLDKFYEIKIDTGLVAAFALLQLMEGTHTYNPEDSSWSHTDEPADQVIFIYPFIGNSGEQEAKIVISNAVLLDDNATLNLAIFIDGSQVMTMAMTLSGSNFTMPFMESSMTSVDIQGTIVGQSGVTANYSINITDTSVMMNLSAAGVSGITVTAEGSGILSSGISGEGDPTSNIETVTIAVGANIEFVVTDLNAESGKVGDVYYMGEDVGDLVSDGEDIYIQYEGGNKVAMAELMPNAFSLIGLLGGIG